MMKNAAKSTPNFRGLRSVRSIPLRIAQAAPASERSVGPFSPPIVLEQEARVREFALL
jgi:hypothetical protein